jgi:hypothetical protein
LSQAHRAIADGLYFDDNVPIINHDNIIIWKNIVFKTMEAMKIRLAEYMVFQHYLFIIKHSVGNKCHIVICRHGFPWTIHARKGKDDGWRITSVIQSHTYSANVDDRKHAQLLSRFISQRLVNIIKIYPIMTIVTLIEVVMVA